MQCVSGEVLTRPEVLERLKVEEENRKKKQQKQKQQSKPGTSKVSISIKNVPAAKSKDTGKPKIQKSLSHFGLTVEKKSIYNEVSDSDLDDSKEDPKDNPKESQKNIIIKQLKPNVYVIVCYEESYFPGLVVRVRKSEIKVKCMSKSGLATWSWPKHDDLHDYTITEIIKVIDSPTMANNRGDYFVPEIEKYWK